MVDDKIVCEILKKLDMIEVWEKVITLENPLTRIFRQDSPFKITDVLRWAYVESKGMNLAK